MTRATDTHRGADEDGPGAPSSGALPRVVAETAPRAQPELRDAPVFRLAAEIVLLAVVYVIGTRVGFMYALVGTNASPIWPPAGIAVGALVLGGRRLWPGILLGAIAGNLLNGATPAAATILAAGAIAEALLAVEVLRRARFRPQLDHLRDIPVLAIGSALPAALGATIGVGGLTATGAIGVEGTALAWTSWWIGDALSILVLGGVILAWFAPPARVSLERPVEALVAFGGVALASTVLFFDVFNLKASGQSVAFPVIPVVVWVAFRIGPRGTSLAAVLFSAIAIAATEQGLGPFVGTSRESTLLYVALFIGLVAISGDGVAAVVAERDADRALLEGAGARASTALRQLQAMEAIGRMLAQEGPTPPALQSVVDALADVFGYTHPSIYTGDERLLRLGAQRGYTEMITEFDGSVGVLGRAMRTREPQFLPDVTSEPAFLRVASDVRSEIAVPLLSHGTLLGVLNVESRLLLDERDLASVSVVADRVAAALALALERDRLLELAVRDGLTGLHNRRFLDDVLHQLHARRIRDRPEARGPLAVIMFDLDHFGDFNKRHGHQVGDEVLRVFGAILRRRFRASDIVSRYGGEEFVAVLPGADASNAAAIADEIRTQLQATPIEGTDGAPLEVTVSAGCAAVGHPDETPEDLIRRADVALAMAKRAGRNRVVAA